MRDPIVVDVDDSPVRLSIRGTVYSLRGDVGGRELLRVLAPLVEQADQLQAGEVSPDDAVQLMTDALDTLAQLLVDPAQADQWRELDLPVAAFLQIVQVLVEAWTGRPTTPS